MNDKIQPIKEPQNEATMAHHSDLTFITNEEGRSLLERFRVLIKDSPFFDVLVGYFYTSGFHALFHSLESTEKIRILVGIGIDKQAAALVSQTSHAPMLPLSYGETEAYFSTCVIDEMENSEDSRQVEEGVTKFREWLQSGKLEIKVYPKENIHAKLYIMSFAEGDRDIGRVITGSSNFSQSGLADNLEFNVELKSRSDYEFAKAKFEELWEDAIDVGDRYVQTIQEETWLSDAITPYELYLKFLYEYFKDDLSIDDELEFEYTPEGFKILEYQKQAVLNAEKILAAYGGVFISDVVGLGKTYMSAMLAKRLDGRTLVLAPPALLDKNNPGAWQNVFSDFNIPADYESLGQLDGVINRGMEKYRNVFIDEAHRFRTESNTTYESLAKICRGKRVILVTATPLNNVPRDILSQIKLFQSARKSVIPNITDLEKFFGKLEGKLKGLDRRKDYDEYMRHVKNNAHRLRKDILRHLMVRRTRDEIQQYFTKDLKTQELKFPQVEAPEPVFYQLNEMENEVFNRTLELITRSLRYARYMPMAYYEGEEEIKRQKQSQGNLARFMKILLIKRLESSFYAFQKTIQRFIQYYTLFLQAIEELGTVYVVKERAVQLFELVTGDDEEKIEALFESGKVKAYPIEDFQEELMGALRSDLNFLQEIDKLWRGMERDPKLLTFSKLLREKPILQKGKLIVFTESKETADYLVAELGKIFPSQVLAFSGSSGGVDRRKVIENFDARHNKDDYRILITTEVLSEGVNLHRSNIVINYDIPWNPTRLMQRVGRINRIGTAFDKIYSFNFFPTEQSNDRIKLEEAAKAKIAAFIMMLGADARLLTESETVESHRLFEVLTSKSGLTDEDGGEESELKYLQVIKTIRDEQPQFFQKIKSLPKKARSAKLCASNGGGELLTYFRRGRLQKFFLTGSGDAKELDFIEAAKRFECAPDTEKKSVPADFYDKLKKNKQAFQEVTTDKEEQRVSRGSEANLRKMIKAIKKLAPYPDDEKKYLDLILERLTSGALPKQTIKTTLEVLEEALSEGKADNPPKLLGILKHEIAPELLTSHRTEAAGEGKPREIILSEYLMEME